MPNKQSGQVSFYDVLRENNLKNIQFWVFRPLYNTKNRNFCQKY